MKGWRIGVTAQTAVTILALPGTAGVAAAAELRAEMRQATPSGSGAVLGTVMLGYSAAGVVVKTALNASPPGAHCFPIHENGHANRRRKTAPVPPAAPAAISTRRPEARGSDGNGHLGDSGAAGGGGRHGNQTRPRRTSRMLGLRGKAVMIHGGGDNCSDQPARRRAAPHRLRRHRTREYNNAGNP